MKSLLDQFNDLLPSGDIVAPEGFYVYALYLSKYGMCYVGKGVGLRAWDHPHNIRKIMHARLTGKISSRENAVYTSIIRLMLKHQRKLSVKIIASGLTEEAAFFLESNIIANKGRVVIGDGLLFNLADGGKGVGEKYFSAKSRYKNGLGPLEPSKGNRARQGKRERDHAEVAFGLSGSKVSH